MKKKLLNSMRVLLVAAGLCVGQSAWADVPTYTWDFTNTTTWTTAKVSTGSAVTLNPSGATPGTGEYGITFKFTSEKGQVKYNAASKAVSGTGLWFYANGSAAAECVSITVPSKFKVTFNFIGGNLSGRPFVCSTDGGTTSSNKTSSPYQFINETASDVTVTMWASNCLNNSSISQNCITSIVLQDFSAAASHTWSAKAYATISGEKTEIGSWNAGGAEYNEGDTYNVWAKKVIYYGGHYYELDDAKFAANAVYFNTTMGDADAAHEITYTQNDDIAFYTECEDWNSGQKTNSLISSNGAYVYYYSDTKDVSITDAGVYRLETFVMDNDRKGKSDINVYNGEEVLVTIAKGTAGFRTSGSFALAADATIKIGNTGNNSMSLDYILVRKLPFAEGKYYLKNKGNGAYFAAGQNWSTQAITNNIGHVVGLECNSEGTWYINTYINGSGHYLNGLWCDQAALGWTFTDAGEGYYKISSDGVNFITAGAVGAAMTTTTGTGDNTKWQLLTEAEWKAEQVARLSAASYTSGVDATFYLPGANFNRQDDDENAKWQGTPGIDGPNQSEGCNFNAEKYSTTPFDVYQSLTGVKPGIYKVTCQGFYRNGTTDDRKALLYANSFETPLVNIKSAGITAQDNDKGFTTANGSFYVPNTQTEAAKAFNNDYYGDNELWFVVGDDGALRIGVKKNTGAESDWALFDNFQLTYYGATIPATIGATGWTTFASPYALNLSSLAGATAYYASAVGVESVTMTSTESSAVAAGEGLMLKGTAGATVSIPVVASGSNIDGNLLVGCTTSTKLDANDNYYVLVNNSSTAEFQNLSAHGATIPAGKAYLDASAAGAKSLTIVFDNETLGISDAARLNGNAEDMGEKAIYNLSGQRIAAPQKGINIIGGRKVVVK